MHQVEHYDFVISRHAENPDKEILLLAVERDDIPTSFGEPIHARWMDEGEELSLEMAFSADPGATVKFSGVARNIAEPLVAFPRVLITWMSARGVVDENDIPLHTR